VSLLATSPSWQAVRANATHLTILTDRRTRAGERAHARANIAADAAALRGVHRCSVE
jgi:hypothetical protein